MPETKKTVAAEKPAAAKATVKEEAKATVKNVEEKVKAAAKKVVTKTTETKDAVAKKASEKKPAAKKTAARKPAAAKKAPKTEVVLQYAGKEVMYADIIKKATQLSKKALKANLKDVKIYVKPEENMAYYVANGGEQIGSFQI